MMHPEVKKDIETLVTDDILQALKKIGGLFWHIEPDEYNRFYIQAADYPIRITFECLEDSEMPKFEYWNMGNDK